MHGRGHTAWNRKVERKAMYTFVEAMGMVMMAVVRMLLVVMRVMVIRCCCMGMVRMRGRARVASGW